MVKLAVSDIDGTLVDTQKRISPLNRKVIKAFQEKGGAFTLATGRIERSAIPYCRELDIQVPLILYNGARIVHPVTGRVLYEKALSEADVTRALVLREMYPLDYIIYSDGEPYVFGRSENILTFEKGDGYECNVIGSYEELKGRSVTKILMIGDNAFFDGYRNDFSRDKEASAVLVQSEPTYLEILPAGVNKGTALERLEMILGIDKDEVICFGDNMNDVEMIRRAGIGVAMGNAGAEVKAAADCIAPDHNDDGVARVLAREADLSDISI